MLCVNSVCVTLLLKCRFYRTDQVTEKNLIIVRRVRLPQARPLCPPAPHLINSSRHVPHHVTLTRLTQTDSGCHMRTFLTHIFPRPACTARRWIYKTRPLKDVNINNNLIKNVPHAVKRKHLQQRRITILTKQSNAQICHTPRIQRTFITRNKRRKPILTMNQAKQSNIKYFPCTTSYI